MKNHVTNLKKWMSLAFRGFIMAVFMLAFTVKVSANRNVPDDKIQLKIENGTIKEALKEIERQCNFTFIYNDANINVNQVISVSCSGKSIQELLDDILTLRGIKYTFVDNHIVLTNASAKQEKRTISGNVKDAETGEGLPGVTVLEVGTTNGTVTDVAGNFTLTVAETSSIQVSYVGYTMQNIIVAGAQDFSIVLNPELVNLSEIVVIGYGTVKKSDLTGAVATVSAEDIKSNVGSGIDQALQGKTAGVSVTTNSGTPGASPSVRIRGMGTVTNPNPFYVVDGMPLSAESVGSINPGDIESMEVLKDASAAAIYGARAANGVVLITTKRAKEGKSSISLDAYTGIQSVAKKYELTNSSEWMTLGNNGVFDTSFARAVNTDWQDEIFRNASISNVQLSLLNGSEKVRFAVTGSYFNQEGIIIGSDYERYTFRVNTTCDLKKWLTIGENIGYSNSGHNLIPEQDEYTSVVIEALTMDPITPVYNEDGVTPAASVGSNVGNPVGHIERNHNTLNSNQLLGNVFVEIKPFSWLTFRSSVGTEISRYVNEQFFPIFTESSTIMSERTSLIKGDFKMDNWLAEQLLTFNKSFGTKHSLQAMIGYTAQSNVYRFGLAQVFDIPENEDLWYISNGEASSIVYVDTPSDQLAPINYPIAFSNTPYDATMISYLGRIIYSYGGRYDVTASIRRDGSSKFKGDNQWGNFPSFAAGWKLSEEPFFPKNNVLNFFKLRAGWGTLGNQEIGNYNSYANLGYGFDYVFGAFGNQNTATGGAPTGYANELAQWETTYQTNLGFDASLMRFKLTINFDYFRRLTDDMLCRRPVPGVSGIQDAPTVNIGQVSNNGYEINVAYREQEGDFHYKVGANFGHVKNEVLEFGDPMQSAEFRATNPLSLTDVGQPIASFYGFKTDGYYQNQAEIDALNAETQAAFPDRKNAKYDPTTEPGDIKMVDVNGDHQITSDDRTFIGSPHPKFTYGVSVDLDFKGIDLKIFGQGVYGNKVCMATIYYLESGSNYWNNMTTMNDHWQKEGDNTAVPRLGDSEANMRISDRYIKDGSFFRIKNLQLGYTLPASLTSRIGIESVRIYANAQNLLSFHNYPGFDPEIGIGRTAASSGVLDIGVDRGMYPLARTITGGINLTF